MTIEDHPDFMQDVDRSPVQNIGYQIYGVYSAENIVAAANSLSSSCWNIPNDSYWYQVESVYIIVDHLFLFETYVSKADNQSAPVWSILSRTFEEGHSVIDLSLLGAFNITYPGAMTFGIYNYRNSSVTWSVYANYYKYLPG